MGKRIIALLFHCGETMQYRTLARESALKALFMCDLTNDWSETCLLLYFRHFETNPKSIPYATLLCRGVVEDLKIIDYLISTSSNHWSIERISAVDRSVLRLSVFEILRVKNTPHSIILNEAIMLAKKYSSESSPSFINGVLDCVYHIISSSKTREEDITCILDRLTQAKQKLTA